MGFLQRVDRKEEWYIHSRNLADEALLYQRLYRTCIRCEPRCRLHGAAR